MQPRASRCTVLCLLAALAAAGAKADDSARQWLAGDSHIHSHWSAGYNRTLANPAPIQGGDSSHSTPDNARMARKFGLSWMVTTDHGGPNHARFSLEQAYEELKESRKLVPEVLQFYGMELNMPGMDHHTLIIPHSPMEGPMLHDIEHRFDALEVWPVDPARNTDQAAANALDYIKTLPLLPLMFANHPSRSAKAPGQYGLDEPRELRRNQDRAPRVYRGMEGAPGHQAAGLAPDGKVRRGNRALPTGARGSYRGSPTLGGFDPMTAVVGGVWDSMLGEGRRFWIVATSDSHVHFTDSPRVGHDFWPGEFHKTYVLADRTYDGILQGLRAGRIFAVSGDLISELDLTAGDGASTAGMGQTLRIGQGQDVKVTIRFRDPHAPNAHGDHPRVARVDLITGQVRSPSKDLSPDRNETTRVAARFTEKQWSRQGEVCEIHTTVPAAGHNFYLRLRGTSTPQLEPAPDTPGENPWEDLWFYSNPIFVEVR